MSSVPTIPEPAHSRHSGTLAISFPNLNNEGMKQAEELTEISRVRDLLRSGAARSVRLGSRLSLGEVARALDVSPATVYRWETHQRVPRGEVAIRYLALLERLMRRSA